MARKSFNCIACGVAHERIIEVDRVCYDCIDQIMEIAEVDPTIAAISKKHAEACREMEARMAEIAKAWAAENNVEHVEFEPAYDSCNGFSPRENRPVFRELNVIEKLAREEGSE